MFFSLERFGVPSPAADVAAAQRLYSNGKKREIGWMDLQWNYTVFWNETRRNEMGSGKDVVDEVTGILEQQARLTHLFMSCFWKTPVRPVATTSIRHNEVLRGVIQWDFIYSKVGYLKIIKSFALPIGKAHYQIHILINSVKTIVYELFIISIVMLFLRGRTSCRN
ncbi:hypothetical protein F9U42_05560 [Pectobacterium versatile]|uniref:hypothetical protein n=1 Tax=Pectobacterium versatile TaxID=2488639 RepID=UPI001B39BD32|nr:hypothetical protein [Pectobacterium versatile]MBQ4766600.1 hypothetical protein [Pectobacterium versatile]